MSLGQAWPLLVLSALAVGSAWWQVGSQRAFRRAVERAEHEPEQALDDLRRLTTLDRRVAMVLVLGLGVCLGLLLAQVA